MVLKHMRERARENERAAAPCLVRRCCRVAVAASMRCGDEAVVRVAVETDWLKLGDVAIRDDAVRDDECRRRC